MPPQRMLTRVTMHARWLDCLLTVQKADATTPHPTVRHRETARFISVSQETSGSALDIAPDGTFSTTVPNHHFTTYLQRRGGLAISAARSLVEACAADGDHIDAVGDSLANNVEHNRRHNSTLNKTYDMITAVAVGQVGKGDKEDADATAALNAGTVVDIFELEGDEMTGGDALTEIKVPSPTTKTRTGGRGSAKNGGNPESVGHLVGFGNTEEIYRRDVYGLKGRGRKRDGPFNHRTGRGWVKAREGTYHDAIHVKKSRVSLMLVEATGAISPRSLTVVGYHSRRARGARGRDSTKYGKSRASTTNYYIHHVQRISMAAAIGEAAGIHRAIMIKKQARCADMQKRARSGAA